MTHVYPLRLSPNGEGGLLISFRDVPEALSEGENVSEALALATDCLVCALGGYVDLRRPVPAPSPPEPGERLVTVPPLVAAKLALYQAMLDAGLSAAALARRLGLSETAVRRLLDLDHRSHIGQVERALAALGKRLVVAVEDAA